jgi:hypothetical protein
MPHNKHPRSSTQGTILPTRNATLKNAKQGPHRCEALIVANWFYELHSHCYHIKVKASSGE